MNVQMYFKLTISIFLLIGILFGFNFYDVKFTEKLNNDNNEYDKDFSKKLDPNLIDNIDDTLLDLIIHYTDDFNYDAFKFRDRINYFFREVNAFKIKLFYDEVHSILQLEEIIHIEIEKKIQPLLLDSTSQMGIVNSFWKNGEFGSSNLSIAIVDSGIDPTHDGFKDNLIATFNAIDNNNTFSIDNIGHGTHVAGIASSSTNMSGIYKESFRDKIPLPCDDRGCPLSFAHKISNIQTITKIDVKLDWGEKNIDETEDIVGVAIFDPKTNELACELCYISSNLGYINESVYINPGTYFVGIFNEMNGENKIYESSIAYNRTGLKEIGENINGIAFGSKLVVVKVIDDMMGGDIETFENGINWIIENRREYNIVVVNLSLGLNQTSLILDKLMNRLVNNGILPVAAAGNLGSNSGGIFSPASAPETLTVGAINNIGEIAYYTNVGSNDFNGLHMKPDVLAPGGSYASPLFGYKTSQETGFGLISAPDASLNYDIQKNDFIGYQGTSMASPHVAGLAMLLASQLHEKDGWEWESRKHPMYIKQLIMTGTFEVGNVGIGRELSPFEEDDNKPKIDRNKKDFQEGWGAIDARAISDLLESEINIGFTQNLTFNYYNPFYQKTYAWKLNVTSQKNYVFDLDVPDGVDLDIKLISFNGDGSEFGEINILNSTILGMDENERLIFDFEHDDGIFVVVTIVDSNINDMVIANFRILETEFIPKLKIISPQNDEILGQSVVIDYETNLENINLLINQKEILNISKGYVIENLIEGKHNLTLYGYDYDGNRITSNVTFYVEYDEKNDQVNSTTTVTYDSTIDLLAINYYFPMISIIFINFLRKISTKWMIG